MGQRGQRACARAALIPGDRDMVRPRLGHTGRDRADTNFGHQLDRDTRLRIGVLQVVDELRQILDRVDVVVRRRRDQADARRRIPHAGDVLVHLVAGQLSAFARLRALRHLDLDVVGIDQILGRDAKPARRHLLDGGAFGIAVRQRLVAIGFLAALAGVGLAADPVHRDRQRGVRLARDRAEAHGAGGEALDDFLRRFDLVDRHRVSARA